METLEKAREKKNVISFKKIAAIVIVSVAAIMLLYTLIFYSTPKSPYFKGAYFNYTVTHPFIRDGYMYIKILNANDTHIEY
ncbi:MAG: hypothetical protein QW076_06235 [Candidatus Anstonellales archaeon]